MGVVRLKILVKVLGEDIIVGYKVDFILFD